MALSFLCLLAVLPPPQVAFETQAGRLSEIGGKMHHTLFFSSRERDVVFGTELGLYEALAEPDGSRDEPAEHLQAEPMFWPWIRGRKPKARRLQRWCV